MTYQSPGLRRSSFLSATAGSSSSSSGMAASSGVASAGTSSVSVVSSTASAAVLSSRCAAASSAITIAGSAASASASETAEGDSPSKEVTCQSSLNFSSSAEHQRDELQQAKVDQADQRHHERQEDQHHGGVVDHLLAVGPDHLAQLGDDLLQVVPDEGERVERRPVGGLLCGLDLDAGSVLGGSGLGPGRQVDGLAGILIDRAAPRPLACRARRAGHHRGLTAGVTDAIGNAVGYGASLTIRACGAGTIALVAHRMPFVWFLWVTFQCPHLSSIQLSRGDRT